MAERTFQALEQAGWTAKAEAYDELIATITDQAIAPILDTFGDIADKRVLDVACGTGHIAGVARIEEPAAKGSTSLPPWSRRQKSVIPEDVSGKATPSNSLTTTRASMQSLVDSVCSTWRDRIEQSSRRGAYEEWRPLHIHGVVQPG